MSLVRCALASKLINIIQLMKQQKVANKRREMPQGLPAIDNPGFNQTIIINNPNFNINYIDHAGYNVKPNSRQNNNKTVQELVNIDAKNSSKGIDAWNLNKNLKQFSQTRQLGFFKNNASKTRSNIELQHSPYLSHKTKTQDIKPYIKIRPGATIQPTSFRQNKTISTIKHETLLASPRDHSALSNAATIQINDDSRPSFRKRKFQSRPRNPKSSINDHHEYSLEPYIKEAIDLTETIHNNGSKTERKIITFPPKARKNRFAEVESEMGNKKNNQQNQQQGDVEDLQNSLIVQSHKKTKSNHEQRGVSNPVRKKALQKSIDKISKCFLSKMDNYFDGSHNVQIPSSKIELYTTTMHQPTSYSYNIDYKSSPLDLSENGYDFQFEDQKPKNRPKTPYKRKKMYEQIN